MYEFSENIYLPNLTAKLESVQYSAALAVRGSWRGTSLDKEYTELGWESLSCRRWIRHLTLFYNFVNILGPEQTIDPVPSLHQSQSSLRVQDVIGQLKARIEKIQVQLLP